MIDPVFYDGNYITCYPGSNQQDSGKLQLEYNMARLVTRVTSKNFCIVKPSYALSIVYDSTGGQNIQVGAGQCSINGMDLIMTQSITLPPPGTSELDIGKWYIAFKLRRDAQDNVLGDLTYGVTVTFEGVSLAYYPTKEDNPDMFYLGSVNWDGQEFSELEEDEDKYGRIWAEDILCKIDDPKHPNVTRLNLQQWLYRVPDWYFSKEGDIIYGRLEMTDGRDGSGESGIIMECTDGDTSTIIVKAPTTDIDDPDKVMRLIGTDDGTEIEMGKSSIYVKDGDNYVMNFTSENTVNLHSDEVLKMSGDLGVEIGGGATATNPKLTLKDDKAELTSSTAPNLVYNVTFVDDKIIQNKLGKAIWQYDDDTDEVSLLSSNVSYLHIIPPADYNGYLRARSGILVGAHDIFGNEYSYIKPEEYRVGTGQSVYTQMTPTQIKMSNGTNPTTIDKSQNEDKLTLSGSLIIGDDLTVTDDAYLQGTTTFGNPASSTGVVIDAGDITADGEIRASKVWNAVYNDYAEIFEKNNDEIIEPGDVVCIGTDSKVHKVQDRYDIDRIIGVCSDTAGMLLGGKNIDQANQVVVGLVGQIWTKTSELNIMPGQLLQANADGTVSITKTKVSKIGIALSTIREDGKVLMLYNG